MSILETKTKTKPSCQVFHVQPTPRPPLSPAGLEDIWPRLHNLMMHAGTVIKNENTVQGQQRAMIRDGCFLMPSLFEAAGADLCTRSWFHEAQFYYEFKPVPPHERYFWITGLLDRGYSLDTLWLPNRGIAVTIYPSQIDCARIGRFHDMLAKEPEKPVWSPPWTTVKRTAIIGFQHLMHMMWNELPALDRLVGTPLPRAFDIAATCEPFGPTRELFPELAAHIRLTQYSKMGMENSTHGLLLGLGSWTITPGTQERVLRVATAHTSQDTLARQSFFKTAHDPVFWLSVKPPKRTVSDQSEVLAGLINALHAELPSAGFILNGASIPWDFPNNPNYQPWFHRVSQTAVQGSAAIIEELMERLDTNLRDHVISLNDISVCEEVSWGKIATFYICHGGTMQNKIGWVHRIPGFMHSNRGFLKRFRLMSTPVVAGPSCYFASDELVVDDEINHYTPLEMARLDKNYSFTSLTRLVEEVMDALLQEYPNYSRRRI
jgi:hypothetical protein